MYNIIGWFTTALSLGGNWFVIKKHWLGFVLWFIANTVWIIIDINMNIYSQAALFAAYNVLAIIGFVAWFRLSGKGVAIGHVGREISNCIDCVHAIKHGGALGMDGKCVRRGRVQIRYDKKRDRASIVCVGYKKRA